MLLGGLRNTSIRKPLRRLTIMWVDNRAMRSRRSLLRDAQPLILVAVALAVWASGLLTSCGSKPKTAVIVVLFDVSASTVETRERYLHDFEKHVLDKLQGGDFLIADLITENPLATRSYPIDEKFPAFNPVTDNRLTYEQEMQKRRERIKQVVKDLLQQSRKRTNLLDALAMVGKTFNEQRCKGMPYKVLIVFSDMIEQSDQYDFASTKLTDARTRQIIETLRKQGRLPDLKGVKVWVAGATAAKQGGLKPDKIYEIENFWIEYFKACGAELTRERYAPVLVDFDLER
jgi:hypothetical protein